ncbi:BZ3500_MvSof-1268-A1-R1_Chr2-1g04351 [Microbotryum saponariae]|uniref:BZ3500_MvSof-1268-A1-R1_Chr2-1g04351 protein n=1 Tax=Microbotryum saponariae TaxID=289078 RepID=A0A2X0K8A7_9BASI|nr:BZ3500_MvSof-1268-A1-R1_Chr2-1g04351 [Microbotryum saponariae]SCZ91515.1 BZ3501_MvSof-1269-A2-R1_Chr2-1g04007 [Microbotryum saponariae]
MSTPVAATAPKRALSPNSPGRSTASIMESPSTSTSNLSNVESVQANKKIKMDEAGTQNGSSAPKATTAAQLPPQTPAPGGGGAAARKSNKNKQGKKKIKAVKPGGAEEVGAFDVVEFLGPERVEALEEEAERSGVRDWSRKEAEKEWGFGAEGKSVQVRVVGLNAHGDGLAKLIPSGSTEPTRLVTIPFAIPGELVNIKVTRHEPDLLLSHSDLIDIIEPSEKREAEIVELPGKGEPTLALQQARKKFGNRVQCQYFGTCSGCQYQPLAYSDQLEIKRTVVRKAFANFSKLPPSSIPPIGPTLRSPLEYQYRTKLTPHFQTPPTGPKKKQFKGKDKVGGGEEEEVPTKKWELTIGFEQKGRKRVIDIEECVIGTKVINEEYKVQREEVKKRVISLELPYRNIAKYKRGSTLLLRDSLPRRAAGVTKASTPPDVEEKHVCISDHHATVREKVGTNEFEQVAGSFFQNNSSILPSLIDCIAETVRSANPKTTHLIDAYCGSGLFAISLADQFERIEGVEIDKQSVKWARMNAEWNKGPGRGEVGFRDGKAEDIFGASLHTIDFPADSTTILIDPPRKGCDELFLSQLLAFNPSTIIYVSCNVHTQARDIGWIVSQSKEKVEKEGKGKKGFWIESLRAADLFANTHHAEGLAILRREV